MTYNEYANMFLEGSEIPCRTIYPPMIRNSMYNLNGNIEGDYNSAMPLNATGITGNVDLLFVNEYPHNIGYGTPESTVRDGNYIYLSHRITTGATGDAAVREYNLTDMSYTDLVYTSQSAPSFLGSPSFTHKSLVAPRILFQWDEADWNSSSDLNVHFRLLDFNTSTVTIEREYLPDDDNLFGMNTAFTDIVDIRALTNSDGDTILYIISTYESLDGTPNTEDGILIQYRNYTQSGEWQVMKFFVPTSMTYDGANAYATGINYQRDAITVVGQYIVVSTIVDYWVQNPIWDYAQIPVYFVYNTETNTGTYCIDDNIFDPYGFVAWSDGMISDPINGNVYMLWGAYAVDNWSVIEFNPATLTISTTWTAPTSYPDTILLYSRTKSYIYETGEGILYDAHTGEEVVSIGVTTEWIGSFCITIDDGANGEGILWLIDSSLHILGYSILTGTQVYNIPTEITPERQYTIYHLVDCLLCVIDNYISPTTHKWWYYLIT